MNNMSESDISKLFDSNVYLLYLRRGEVRHDQSKEIHLMSRHDYQC